MKLLDLLKSMTREERVALADDAGTSPVYLYQCATGFRRTSPRLALRLVECEPRLTLAELRPDIWSTTKPGGAKGAPKVPRMKAAA